MKIVLTLFALSFAIVHLPNCGIDSDGDGQPDITDHCPDDPNKTQPGLCGCNVVEGECSIDPDSDGGIHSDTDSDSEVDEDVDGGTDANEEEAETSIDVAIIWPLDGAVYEKDDSMVVKVESHDASDIDAMRLWIDGVYHSVVHDAPYEFSVSDLAVGSHTLVARAKDQLGNTTVSEPITITMIGSQNVSMVNQATEWVKYDENPLTIKLPSGAKEGDILILSLGTSGKKPDTPTGGWTLIDSETKSDNGNCSLFTYYKIYKPGIPTSYTYLRGNRKYASLVILRGIDTSDPVKEVENKKVADTHMDVGQKGDIECPSVDSANGGITLFFIMYDDNITVNKFVDSNGDSIKIVNFRQDGGDGFNTAIRPTSGGQIGQHRSVYISNSGGLVYAISMSISFRPR